MDPVDSKLKKNTIRIEIANFSMLVQCPNEIFKSERSSIRVNVLYGTDIILLGRQTSGNLQNWQ